MLEPSRKHGYYDQRWPSWSFHSASTTPNGATVNWPSAVNGVPRLQRARDDEVGRRAVAVWEGEGGSTPGPGHENGRITRLEPESVVDGLSWEMFSETFYPGKKRHYFPAISAWSRSRDGDSWPKEVRQRAPALIAGGRSS